MAFLGLRPSRSPAIVDTASGAILTFADVLDRGHDVASRLGATKQLLFLVARNDLFSVVTYAGVVASGHALALLDGRSPTAASADIIGAYRPRWVAGPAGLARELGDAGVAIESVDSFAGGELIRTGLGAVARVHPETAVLLTTSGTTGSRKFVRLSASNVEANANSIAQYLELDPGERPVTSLPLHYSFGLSVLNSHWRAGACVVLTDESVVQPSFWEAFRRNGCTSIAGVPFSYQLLERVGFREMDLPALRTMQQAGGALDRRLTEIYARFMADRGGRLFVMYGQTEATARIAYVPPHRLAEKLGSAGIAIPGGSLEIDPETVELRVGVSVGEVVYRGPNVMMGYASCPEDLELGDMLGGVLRTGDIGRLDGEGYLFLVGRSKRIAKVFGHRINLDEVEARLREHGPAAVVGGQDSIWGFCEFGTEESVAELAASLARDLRLHHTAIRLRRVDAIPTSASGKIDYRAVEAWVTG